MHWRGGSYGRAARQTRPAQALVEFALSISLFMLLVLGTFDVARAYLAYTVVANAAREASRYGAAHCCAAGWQQAAQQAGQNLAVGVDPASLTLAVSSSTSASGLTYVTVAGSFAFHTLTPLVRSFLGDPINMSVNTSAPVG
jgi:Flp pilus assembly protein TadG